MSNVTDRFLRYVSMDTQSMDDQEAYPSTEKQRTLAAVLAEELISLGAADVSVDAYSYVTATIPATTDKEIPVLGLISHMDTSPACSGKDIKPQIIRNYDGKDIVLSKESGLTMRISEFPELQNYAGNDLITTDGTTLLGADDKAGVAEIMTMAEYLLAHPEIPHGTIRIGFTPDEEVGRGTDFFDVQGFGAEVAYTVDGGQLGELEYENFNAATAKIRIHGISIHTGSAKGKMVNALHVGMEFHSMLPVFENPAFTEGYEGFFHLDSINGGVELAKMKYLIRDHDMNLFNRKKEIMQRIAAYLNEKYGAGTVELNITDSYFNMREKVEPHIYLVDIATDAMKEIGVEPIIRPIRGGTDGARLSFKGLPCPNLCTGGHNFHGRYEYISIQSMEKVVELLLKIVERFQKR